jgi:signal transduction histidine kinase
MSDRNEQAVDGNTGATEDDSSSMSVIAHIQTATEHEKALLARELHDELGGLLVGAVMDVAWAEQHLSAPASELKQKLLRARQTLSAAIDMKRKLIEDLRPTLLDNVGLFAALRWHVQATCTRTGVACTIHLPEEEQRFRPHIPIALFRIVQEAFVIILTRGKSALADFSVTIERKLMTIRITSDAVASLHASSIELHSLAAIRHRTASLGGEFTQISLPTGGTVYTAQLPIDPMLLPT